MAKVNVYKQTGESAGTLTLDDSVFGIEYNEPLIHQVITAQRANARQGTKCTLTRTEVRGGGKKPWRQKGTGNARQGSIRSPQWKGGGVVFAPKPRDFSQKVNKQAKHYAFCSALSAKVDDGDLIVVDKIALKAAKTKEMVKIIEALKLEKRVLLVLTDADSDAYRAARNIENVRTASSKNLSIYEVVANAKVVMTQDAIKAIEAAYKADEQVVSVKASVAATEKPSKEKATAAKPVKEKAATKSTAEKKPVEAKQTAQTKSASESKPKTAAKTSDTAKKTTAKSAAEKKPTAAKKPAANKEA